MKLLLLLLALSGAAVAAPSPEPVPADSKGASQAAIAAALNREGVDLMFKNKYAEASAKFREAVARVPEARYFFNLGMSLFQEGKFDEALTACKAVLSNSPAADLKVKAEKLIARIRDEAKSQNVTLHE